jgi:hypothetical protein
MRLLTPFAHKAPALTTAPTLAFATPESVSSWYTIAGLGSPFNYVPEQQNLHLYEELARVVPILNRAISATVELVGTPYVEGDDQIEADLKAWMESVPTNRVQTGFCPWFKGWLGDHLLYGRSHMETLFSPDFREIVALQTIHPRTCAYRRLLDGYNLELVQIQPGKGLPQPLNPRRIYTATHDIQTDDPYGRSLLWGLPFVADIASKMMDNLGKSWMLYGTPTYHLNYLPPDKMNDPRGEIAGGIVSGMLSTLTGILRSRVEGDVRHFSSAGNTKIEVIGAGGDKMLDFELPFRTIVEQIVAKTALPPMMLGLQWQAGERIGAVQVSTLSARIDSIRESVTPEVKRLLQMRQRLAGRPAEMKLCWHAPTLTDAIETAQGELYEAQAEEKKQSNDQNLWRLGVIGPTEYARRHRDDLEDLDDTEIEALLPNLAAEPPAPVVPQPFGGGGTAPAAEPPAPRARSLTYGGVTKNGKGAR